MSLLVALFSLAPDALPQADPPRMHQAQASDFDFANAWNGPCTSTKKRAIPNPAFAETCKQWSEPQSFHGVWKVGFETSNFTFMGKMDCFKMRDHSCITLQGEALPWPSKADCNREFEIKFIGRRSRYAVPGHLGTPSFAVAVDRVRFWRQLDSPCHKADPNLIVVEDQEPFLRKTR